MHIDIERTVDEEVERKTEQGWTPGPWQVFKGERCWHVASMDRTFETGCIMFAGGEGSGEANARLIASAPALYDAAQSALNWITVLSQNKPMPEDYHEVVKKLNEALKQQ